MLGADGGSSVPYDASVKLELNECMPKVSDGIVKSDPDDRMPNNCKSEPPLSLSESEALRQAVASISGGFAGFVGESLVEFLAPMQNELSLCVDRVAALERSVGDPGKKAVPYGSSVVDCSDPKDCDDAPVAREATVALLPYCLDLVWLLRYAAQFAKFLTAFALALGSFLIALRLFLQSLGPLLALVKWGGSMARLVNDAAFSEGYRQLVLSMLFALSRALRPKVTLGTAHCEEEPVLTRANRLRRPTCHCSQGGPFLTSAPALTVALCG